MKQPSPAAVAKRIPDIEPAEARSDGSSEMKLSSADAKANSSQNDVSDTLPGMRDEQVDSNNGSTNSAYAERLSHFWNREFERQSASSDKNEGISEEFSGDFEKQIQRVEQDGRDQDIAKKATPTIAKMASINMTGKIDTIMSPQAVTDSQSLRDEKTKGPPALHTQTMQSTAQPGVYAVSGLGTQNSIDLEASVDAIYENVESSCSATGRDDSEEIGAMSEGAASTFLAKAKRVEAEIIFEAEDVQHDRFARRIQMGAIGVAFIAAMAVVIFLLTNVEEKPVCVGDPICCDPIEKQNVFVRCSCSNSTSMMYDGFNEDELRFYDFQFGLVRLAPIWPEFGSVVWDRDSCNPLNQVMLHFSSVYASELSQTEAEGIPLGVSISLATLGLLYASNDGVHWQDDTGWFEFESPCNWFGMGCLLISYIHELRLPNNGLSGSIPGYLSYMTTLHEIDLSSNSLTGTIPSELGSMTQLSALYLGDLQLTGTVPTEITSLNRLGILDLHQNQLTGTISTSLMEMPVLRELEIGSNGITGTFPNSTYNSPQLTIMRLNNNKMTGTIPSEISNLSNLELFNIGNNDFSGPIPSFLGQMDRLHLINFYRSGLTGAIPESFCENWKVGSTMTRLVVNCTETEACSCCSTTMGPFTKVYLQCEDFTPEIAQGGNYRR